MNCRKCLHFIVCTYNNKSCEEFDCSQAENCPSFRNRDNFVELPCAVGDKVFIPDRFGRIDAEIERIEITERGLCYEWVKYDRGVDETEVWDDGSFDNSDIGKTVFLTFEEYEKALERSEE